MALHCSFPKLAPPPPTSKGPHRMYPSMDFEVAAVEGPRCRACSMSPCGRFMAAVGEAFVRVFDPSSLDQVGLVAIDKSSKAASCVRVSLVC